MGSGTWGVGIGEWKCSRLPRQWRRIRTRRWLKVRMLMEQVHGPLSRRIGAHRRTGPEAERSGVDGVDGVEV
jgi:hypothetical protein